MLAEIRPDTISKLKGFQRFFSEFLQNLKEYFRQQLGTIISI